MITTRHQLFGLAVAAITWMSLPGFAQTQPHDNYADEQEKAAGREEPVPSSLPGWAREYGLARFDATEAQSRLRELRRSMPTAGRLWKEYRVSDEYLRAQRELNEALRACDTARQRVLRDAAKNADHQNALARRNEIDAKLEAARKAGKEDEVMSLAEQKMRHSAAATRLETDALAANADVQQAKRRVADARQRLQKLNRDFDPRKLYPRAQEHMDAIQNAQREYKEAARRLVGTAAGYQQALEDRGYDGTGGYPTYGYPGGYYYSSYEYSTNQHQYYYPRTIPYYGLGLYSYPYGSYFRVMGYW